MRPSTPSRYTTIQVQVQVQRSDQTCQIRQLVSAGMHVETSRRPASNAAASGRLEYKANKQRGLSLLLPLLPKTLHKCLAADAHPHSEPSRMLHVQYRPFLLASRSHRRCYRLLPRRSPSHCQHRATPSGSQAYIHPQRAGRTPSGGNESICLGSQPSTREPSPPGCRPASLAFLHRAR